MGEEGFLGKTYKDGDVIVQEGTESREMYVVQSGQVKVVRGSGNTEAVLAILKDGDMFGEMSLLDAKPRSATVKALGEARVLAIDHEMFLKLVRVDPALALRVLRQMGKRIRDLNSKLNAAIGKLDNVPEELVELREYRRARAES
ncbi:MAG: Crp/Fnr family transcriptional regulator [Planctomycetota bacterium]|jgi:CRP/FNR family transcriptional regulator